MPRATDGPRRERVLVLLDATVVRAHDDGLVDYVDALAQGLDQELVIACQPVDADHYRRLAPHAVIEVGPAALRWSGVRMLWRQLALPRIARRHDVDAVHSPWPPVPLAIARPRVVTVHSLDCFDRATPARPGDALRRAAVRTAVRAADEVIAVHPAMPAALAQTVTCDAADVLVTPEAAELDRFSAAHRVAYRAAASLVPAETGPVTIIAIDETPPE